MRSGDAMDGKRVLVAYGTRPEAVKTAPVVRALAGCQGIQPVVVVSGQHREMLDEVNGLLGIAPDADLSVGAAALVGTRTDTIVDRALGLLDDDVEHKRMATAGNPFGDGRTGERSRAAIECLLGVGERIADFDADAAL